MPLYHPENHRAPDQLAEMRRLEAAGICLFCPPHLAGHAHQKVIHRTEHWSVTPNEFPYTGTRLHLLLVPDAHVADLLDLTPAALADFWTALAWVRDTHGLDYYGLATRNGDGRFTGATIEHVHVHVIVGDIDDEAHQPVRFKLSSPRRFDPDQLDPGRP